MAFSGQTFSVGQVLTASEMNQMDTNIDEVRAQHKGGSSPAQLAAGVLWLDDSATPWVWKMHDGASFITLGVVNASTNRAGFDLVKLAEQDDLGAAVSSIDVSSVFDSTYSLYLAHLDRIRPNTDNVAVNMRFEQSASFQATNYDGHLMQPNSGASTYSGTNFSAAAQITMAQNVNNTATEAIDALAWFYRPSVNSRMYVDWHGGYRNNGGNAVRISGFALRSSSDTTTGFQLFAGGGSDIFGRIIVYGVRI